MTVHLLLHLLRPIMAPYALYNHPISSLQQGSSSSLQHRRVTSLTPAGIRRLEASTTTSRGPHEEASKWMLRAVQTESKEASSSNRDPMTQTIGVVWYCGVYTLPRLGSLCTI